MKKRFSIFILLTGFLLSLILLPKVVFGVPQLCTPYSGPYCPSSVNIPQGQSVDLIYTLPYSTHLVQLYDDLGNLVYSAYDTSLSMYGIRMSPSRTTTYSLYASYYNTAGGVNPAVYVGAYSVGVTSPCSSLDQTSCDANAFCQWCPECGGRYENSCSYNGANSNKCVDDANAVRGDGAETGCGGTIKIGFCGVPSNYGQTCAPGSIMNCQGKCVQVCVPGACSACVDNGVGSFNCRSDLYNCVKYGDACQIFSRRGSYYVYDYYMCQDSGYKTLFIPSTEVCDDFDNDCDGTIDTGCDDDKDGYCDSSMSIVGSPSVCPKGGGDTDDADPNVNPGVVEFCDNLDNNKNGNVDEGCDDDKDGYCDISMSLVGAPIVCPKGGGDANDNDPNVHPSEVCAIAGDEDNNGECDYDNYLLCGHGDVACPVGVLAGSLVVADSNPVIGSAVQVSCSSTISGVQSISAIIVEPNSGKCDFQKWNLNVAEFSCKPISSGQKTIRCFVDTAKSYVDTVNGVAKQEAKINVVDSKCRVYTSEAGCVGDKTCEWCPLCNGVKSSGNTENKCVDKGLCPQSKYSCHKDACGAVCDITLGGCANPNPFCDYDTCACSSVNPYGEVCDDGLDNDKDLSIDCVDSDCFGSDACACGSGELLCGDNTCKDSCGNDPAPCNNNKNCEFGESCNCADCNNVKGPCKSGNVCDADTKVCSCSTGLLPCTGGSCASSCGVCGNGIVDQNSGELCDGSDLSGLDTLTGCSELGFDGGVLACVSGVSGCHFDTSQCVGSTGNCGNGVRDVGEECDTSDLGSLNSLTGCSDLGFSDGILACVSGVSGCHFDTAGCFDVASCSADKDCPSGGICDLSLGRCACPPGTSLCADGSCSANCVGSKGCVNQNGLCDADEGCGCADCENKRASCSSDSVCIAGICEVCSLDRAYWEGIGANCKDGVCVVAEGQEVSLVAKGTKGCSGKVFGFNVISEETFLGVDRDKVVAGPIYGVFSNDASSVGWGVVFVGSGLYYFSAETQNVQSKLLSGSNIKVCASDADCDGVLDGVDQCPDTPYGEVVSDEGSNRGCSSSQWACVSQIDCSGVKWGECDDSTNKQVRVICKDKNTGLPDPRADPKSCCDDPDTCLCTLSGCTGKSSWIATKKDCMVEEEFPFFTAGNIVAVLIILVMFYYFYNRKTSKKTNKMTIHR